MQNENETIDFRENLRLRLDALKHDEEKATQKRREGRKVGELSSSLIEKLGNCNRLQLQSVKKLCDKLTAEHKHPPDPFRCRKAFQEEILISVCVKNKRYQLEIRRSALKRTGIYFQRPCLYVYYRDGAYVHADYYGMKENWKGKHVPRKVRTEAAPYLRESVFLQLSKKIISEYESGKRKLPPIS